jgi:hypothetical protein
MRGYRTYRERNSGFLPHESERPFSKKNRAIHIRPCGARIANEIDEDRRSRHHGPHRLPFALDNDSLGALAAVSERAIDAPFREVFTEQI